MEVAHAPAALPGLSPIGPSAAAPAAPRATKEGATMIDGLSTALLAFLWCEIRWVWVDGRMAKQGRFCALCSSRLSIERGDGAKRADNSRALLEASLSSTTRARGRTRLELGGWRLELGLRTGWTGRRPFPNVGTAGSGESAIGVPPELPPAGHTHIVVGSGAEAARNRRRCRGRTPPRARGSGS